MKEYALEIHDLTVTYNEIPVLWDIELEVPESILMAIVGPNGAGKSTLIKSILQLVKPVSGSISFFKKTYKEQIKRIGYVPQRGSVDWDFPTDVLDVVMMGRYGKLGWFKRPTKKDKEICLECIDKVSMLPFRDRQISELSGGQQQRVFLARALAQDADIYFMDEPFQGIDAKTEKSIVKVLQELRSKNKTVIVVHHDLSTVPEYFDYVTLLNTSIIASGPINKVFTEKNISKTYNKNSSTLLKEVR
jgi:manganese/zinc/iron transport system ATP- binding protein